MQLQSYTYNEWIILLQIQLGFLLHWIILLLKMMIGTNSLVIEYISTIFDIEATYKQHHNVNYIDIRHPHLSNSKLPSGLLMYADGQKPSDKNI